MNAVPAPATTAADPFSAVQSALENAALAASSLPLINALKLSWKSARANAADINRAQGGRAAGEALSLHADRMLELLLKHALQRAGLSENANGVAVVALGSYGRRELAPYSDIDMMLLHSEHIKATQLDALVGALLHPMWDCGLQIGHAVRCPEECLNTMADSGDNTLETATSLLESRHVAGDQAFSDAFCKQAMPAFFQKRGRAFVDAKFEETIKRWQGQSVFRTQPNIKDSPGALRDYQLAVWIDKASQLSDHLPRLKDRPLVSVISIDEARAGYEKLLTLRVSLQALCGRKQDVLDFQMQQAVAADLGYENGDELQAIDLLLRDYYRAAIAVHRLAQSVTRRYLEERAIASRDIEKLRRRKLDNEFTRVGDYIYASRDGLLSGPDWLEVALRAFLQSARQNARVGTDIVAAIRARLPEMNDAVRKDALAVAHFEALMRMRDHVGNTLRSMRDCGLLGAWLPEFGEIEGMVISDAYHDFTVDEHTLLVVRAADELYKSVANIDAFRRKILEALPRPHVLRLACLFHDLGKSRGAAGHSERGALMIPAIGERLGLSDNTIRTLIFLLQEHLTLSKISQRRDTGDVHMIQDLAAKIATKERLDLLFLLTYCDSISVGQGAYPLWKDALLTELYKDILAQISVKPGSGVIVLNSAGIAAAGSANLSDEKILLEERLKVWATNPSDLALALAHCRLVPSRYLVEVGYDDAVLHIEALKSMKSENKDSSATVRGSGALVDMWVVSSDRPKRFAQICGALLGENVSVVSAIAYTRGDGIILDHFRLAPGTDSMDTDAAFWKKVAATVEAVLGGRSDFMSKIESVRRRIPRIPRVKRDIEPAVRVDNKLTDKFTVVDVKCGDRVGLLYSLSRAIADLNCDIHFAKIATNMGLVTDVFYITESGGGQVLETEKLLNIKRLLKAVAEDYMVEKR